MNIKQLTTNKTKLNTTLLIIFYGVGLLGMVFEPKLFAKLTPFNLILSVFSMLYGHALVNRYFIINMIFIWVSAWVLEMAGTTTGRIFGFYTYGEALGVKIMQTPIIIGLNWILVCYASIQMAHFVLKKYPLQNIQAAQIALALFAGLFMVILDVFIEPVAPKLDFWYWQDNKIPLQNFTAWFCFGTAFCFWMIKSGIMQNNIMGLRLYIIQLMFFAAINLSQLV
ncbi:MAG: carotenoid biosynthesis protein [Bacteroidia bacterium]